MDKITEKVKINESFKRYELGYLLTPFLTTETINSEINEKIILPLEKLGVEIESQANPQMIDLAYTVAITVEHKQEKYKKAYFGHLIFWTKPELISEIKKELDKSGLFLRYLLVLKKVTKVVSRTIPTTKSKTETIPKKEDKSNLEEVKEEIKTEDIDKEIEELLTTSI